MSYRSGFEALVSRFQDRFSPTKFKWESKILGGSTFFPWREEMTYTIYLDDTEVCQIIGDVAFGIRLSITSPHLKEPFYIYRCPPGMDLTDQYNLRKWLKNKPKFAKIGSSLASTIYRNLYQ